ncbi:hypothetical protein ACFQ4A_17610 [Lentibacillus salinarum]|uniref:Uncharacterized protein n=1 Tax=Lentibacillus salinarum TaxID=446820 RepID=A0ABW3ZYC4_9BACI
MNTLSFVPFEDGRLEIKVAFTTEARIWNIIKTSWTGIQIIGFSPTKDENRKKRTGPYFARFFSVVLISMVKLRNHAAGKLAW